jgi:hypothetical protein
MLAIMYSTMVFFEELTPLSVVFSVSGICFPLHLLLEGAKFPEEPSKLGYEDAGGFTAFTSVGPRAFYRVAQHFDNEL